MDGEICFGRFKIISERGVDCLNKGSCCSGLVKDGLSYHMHRSL